MKLLETMKKQKVISTFILVLLFGLLSFLCFNQIVKSTIDLQPIPVTKTYLKEGTILTEDHITLKELPRSSITEGVITDKKILIGQVVDYGNALAEGSFFYGELLAEKSEVKDAGLFELEEGQIATTLEVNEKTSYSNSLRVGHQVDLFFSGTGVENEGEKEKVIYGELVKQAKVLAIYSDQKTDSKGYSSNNSPSYIVVALSYEDADLVGRAKVFGEVFPVISYDALHSVENPENYYDGLRMKDAIYQRTIDIKLYPIMEGEVVDEG